MDVTLGKVERDGSTVRAEALPGRRVLQKALYAAPVVLFAVLAWQHRWIIDDGFINLRAVHQVVAGHGPVLNAGERVEVFTSPLWLAVLVVGDVVAPLRLEWVAVVLSIGCAVGGIAFAIAGSARLSRDEAGWLLPAGILVPLAVAPMWFFSTSGLEMGLVFAWEGVALWLLAGWAGSDRDVAVWEAAVLGLGWLIRPELVLLSALFMVVVLGVQWRSHTWTRRLALLAAFVALPVAYELFRMGYYGIVVPNTALAKEAGSSRWTTGWHYLREFGQSYALWIPALLLAAGAYVPLFLRFRARRRTRATLVVAAFVVGALLVATYIVRVGGDYIHARLLLPPLFAFTAPVAVLPARRAFAAVALLVPWALVSGTTYREPHGEYRYAQHAVTAARYGYGPGGRGRAWYVGPGLYFNGRRLDLPPAAALPPSVAAAWGIGLTSYAFPNVYVLDMLGLGDPITSHLQLVHRGFPGHEKPLPTPWAAARLTAPDATVTAAQFPEPGIIAPLVPTTTGVAFQRQVAWARAAMQCPAIRKLVASYSAPLSVGRFFSNVVHSVDETRVRIPPDPEKAYRKFCGNGFPPGTR
jgi:arabinofuranosyltransferase